MTKSKVTARKRRVKLSSIVDKVILKFAKIGKDRWIKGSDAKDIKGCPVNATSKKACSFCNEGVVFNVTGVYKSDPGSIFDKINIAWYDVTGAGMVTENDHVSTTFAVNMENWFKVRKYLADQGK